MAPLAPCPPCSSATMSSFGADSGDPQRHEHTGRRDRPLSSTPCLCLTPPGQNQVAVSASVSVCPPAGRYEGLRRAGDNIQGPEPSGQTTRMPRCPSYADLCRRLHLEEQQRRDVASRGRVVAFGGASPPAVHFQPPGAFDPLRRSVFVVRPPPFFPGAPKRLTPPPRLPSVPPRRNNKLPCTSDERGLAIPFWEPTNDCSHQPLRNGARRRGGRGREFTQHADKVNQVSIAPWSLLQLACRSANDTNLRKMQGAQERETTTFTGSRSPRWGNRSGVAWRV